MIFFERFQYFIRLLGIYAEIFDEQHRSKCLIRITLIQKNAGIEKSSI